MSKNIKKIVVLGGGFTGLHAVKKLIKNSANGKKFQVVLVNKNAGHLYTPDLYEVATAFSERYIHKSGLRKSVEVPYFELLDTRKFTFVQQEVSRIESEKKLVVLADGSVLYYDYLVAALGAVTNHYGILGLKEYSLPLKTADDAVRINLTLLENIKKMRFHNRDFIVTVAGGGVTGVEFSMELSKLFNKLAKKYKIERKRLIIQLVDMQENLLDFSGDDLSFLLKRMGESNVFVYRKHRVTRVREHQIFMEKNGHEEVTLPFDLLIWTGGIKVNPVVANSLGQDDLNGAVPVDDFLKSIKHKNVYAGGDNAVIVDNRMPLLAQFAYLEGQVIANNLLAEFHLSKKVTFKARKPIWLIPAGGKFAFLRFKQKLGKGFIYWVLRRLVDLRYYLLILPFKKALRQWYRGTSLFIKND